MAHKLFLFSFFILLFFFATCNSLEPPPPEKTVVLTLEDVSCIEAWIKLTTTNLQLPTTITLKQNDQTRTTITLEKADTLLYVDSLLPNTNYTFQTSSVQYQVSSNELRVTTLDTTSHNFTWQTFTFGEHSSSALYDVAIIDENNIWAVGEIYMNDSLGQPDPKRYNAAIWDGSNWSIQRVPYYYQGQPFYHPIQSVFAFGPNDIWFCGNGVIHWDGNSFIPIPIPTNVWGPYQMNKLWGSSSNDLYVVGNNGNIAHYQNGQWRKIATGTDLQFLDIYGTTDSKTGEQQILAVCTRNYPLGKGIYSIEGNTATQISSNPIQWELFGVWFIPKRHYYVIGSGIYEKKFLSDSTWKNDPLDITHYGTSGIRGNDLSDIFVAGSFGEFLHFNGISWKSYINETGLINGGYGKVAVKNNLVVTVGYKSGQAIVLAGRR